MAARSCEPIMRSWLSKLEVRYDHRPCSTQLTGITRVDWAATRMVVLTIRFCLAPTSSSPSRIRTIFSARLITRRSGTEPAASTSGTSMSPAESASSRVRYSTAAE